MSQDQTISLYQPMLHSIAYNLVRCKEDAEDIVQETFLKWLSMGDAHIENLKAYLIKAVTNNCLNHLAALKRKKEEFFNTHNLKEVLNQFKETNLSHLDLDASLDAALKVLHTKLEPIERAVFLLKEVFDFDYDVLQETFDKKKEHCRQLLSRAKKKLQTEKLNFHIDIPSSKLTELFKNACHFGNNVELVEKLKGDISNNSGK